VSERRLTDAERDKLAADLRKKLRRNRFRPWLWFLAFVPVAAVIVAGVWYGLRLPPNLPPVMFAVYDAIALDGPTVVSGELIAPGHPSAPLGDLDVFWQINRPPAGDPRIAKTQGNGKIAFEIEQVAPGESLELRAWFLDPPNNVRRDDLARVDALGDGPIHVAALSDLVDAPPPIDWSSEAAAALRLKPETAKLQDGGSVIYVAGGASGAEYRAMRSWLRGQFARKDGLPAGPLVRGSAADVQQRIAPSGRVVTRPLEGK
jgi:hypothetical protein